MATGWPKLPDDPKTFERTDQETLDADLDSRLHRYFHELGEKAYAAFNAMTDIATRPPQSTRFRRDRPTLERRAGAWLRDSKETASQPGFSIAGHLKELATGKVTPRNTATPFRGIPTCAGIISTF